MLLCHNVCFRLTLGYSQSFAGRKKLHFDIGALLATGIDKSARIASALIGKHPEMAWHGQPGLRLLHQHGRIKMIHVAEGSVDHRDNHLRLEIAQRFKHHRPPRGISADHYTNGAKIKYIRQRRGR